MGAMIGQDGESPGLSDQFGPKGGDSTAQDAAKKWRGRWWWIGLSLSVVIIAVFAILMARHRAIPKVGSGFPIRVQSSPWCVDGKDIELVIETQPPRPGEVISVTILAPGSGDAQIEGVPPEFFGLSGVQILWQPEEYREPEMLLAASTGARTIGLDFDWRRIEPQRDHFVWDDIDEVVALAKQYGLQLVPMLLYTPRWASTAPFAPLDYQHTPPSNYTDYRDFVYAVVSRYKPYGSSELTADGYGISDWVIWNEPNLFWHQTVLGTSGFWTGDLAEYLELLRAGYEGAHAADPGCNVLNGALADVFWAEGEQDLVTGLERFYDPNGDGDAGDGARPFFDILNIHIYQPGTPDMGWYEERLSAIIEVMARFSDEDKPIWITETGYGSASSPTMDSPYVNEEAQAEAVLLVYRACSAFSHVERVFWWSLRDYYSNGSDLNRAMEAHHGLVRASFDPKPAYLSYAKMTAQVGEVLNIFGSVDSTGVARVRIPGSFVSRPGTYVLFAALEGKAPTRVQAYQTCKDKEQ